MSKRLRTIILTASILVSYIVGLSSPANASSQGDGLSMTVTKTETGTGGSRVITWEVTITDSQGRTFITTGTPNASQILISRSSSRACVTAPTNFSSNHLNSGTCTSYFTRLLHSDASRRTISGSTITFDLKTTDDALSTLAAYDTALASNRPYGAVVAYLKFSDNTGATCAGDLCWNLYGSSTNNWIPGQGATDTPASTTVPSPKIPSINQIASGSLLVTPGTNAVLTGSRLNCTTYVKVNDVATSFTYSALSDGSGQLVIAMPSSLKTGKHALTMDSCGGEVTYLNILTVAKAPVELRLDLANGTDRALGLIQLRAFMKEHRADYNTVTCTADSANSSQQKIANQVVSRYCHEAFSRLAMPMNRSTSVKTDYQGRSLILTVSLSNR